MSEEGDFKQMKFNGVPLHVVVKFDKLVKERGFKSRAALLCDLVRKAEQAKKNPKRGSGRALRAKTKKNETGAVSRFDFDEVAKKEDLIKYCTGLDVPGLNWFMAEGVSVVFFFLLFPWGSFGSLLTFIRQLNENFPASREGGTGRKGRTWQMTAKNVLFLFLLRMRHNITYPLLGIFFGVCENTVSSMVGKALDALSEKIFPRLFYLQDKDTVSKSVPERFQQQFPECLLIGDGVPMNIYKPDTFLFQKMTYSAYKHRNVFMFVICECLVFSQVVLCATVVLLVLTPLQLCPRMDWCRCAPKSMEGSRPK